MSALLVNNKKRARFMHWLFYWSDVGQFTRTTNSPIKYQLTQVATNSSNYFGQLTQVFLTAYPSLKKNLDDVHKLFTCKEMHSDLSPLMIFLSLSCLYASNATLG